MKKIFTVILVIAQIFTALSVFAEGEPVKKVVIDARYIENINVPQPISEENTGGYVAPYVNVIAPAVLGNAELPAKYDSREEGIIYESGKGQNPNNTCWTFASILATETALAKKLKDEGKLVDFKLIKDSFDLSEQHLRYSLSSDVADEEGNYGEFYNPISYFRTPDDGGNFRKFESYCADWRGVVLEKDDPYDWQVNFRDYSITASKPVAYHVQDTVNIPNPVKYASEMTDEQRKAHVRMIKEYIYEYDCLFSSIYWNSDYMNYETESYYSNTQNDSNHAINLIGWDDNYPKENFKEGLRPSENGAFIVKNSNLKNKEGGYMYLSYEDTHAGWLCSAVENVEDKYNYGNVYNWDYHEPSLGLPLGSGETGITTSVYTTEYDDEYVSAVGVYTVSVDVKADVYVSTTASGNEEGFDDYTLVAEDVELDLPGMHTIKLDKDKYIPLGKAGSRYCVRVEFKREEGYTGESDLEIPLECTDEYIFKTPELQPGYILDTKSEQSYYMFSFVYEGNTYYQSYDTGVGIDLWFGEYDGEGNQVTVPIKGRTMTRAYTDANYDISISVGDDPVYSNMEYSVNGEKKGKISKTITAGLMDEVTIHTKDFNIDAVVIDGVSHTEDDVTFTVKGDMNLGFEIPGVKIKEAEIKGNEVNVDFESHLISGKTVIAGLYKGNALIGIRVLNADDVEKSGIPVTFEGTEKPDKVKVMVWDSLKSGKTAIPMGETDQFSSAE